MAGWATQRTYGSKISIWLDKRRWSVRDLAVMVNASTGYLYRVVRGEQEPAWSLLVLIARALGITTDELADDWTEDKQWCPFCGRPWES